MALGQLIKKIIWGAVRGEEYKKAPSKQEVDAFYLNRFKSILTRISGRGYEPSITRRYR